MTSGRDRRDEFEWNPRAAQPNVVLSKSARLLEALRDSPSHLRFSVDCLRRLPRAVTHYRRLRGRRFSTGASRTIDDLVGMGVSAVGGSVSGVLERLEELGLGRVLVRLPYRCGGSAPWSGRDASAQQRLVDTLIDRGFEVLVAVPQDRVAVIDFEIWKRGLEKILERYRSTGAVFQVGQAINRRKWGLWTLDEYVRLLEPALEMRERHPEIQLAGPPVLDAEFHYHLAALGALERLGGARGRFDRFTSQLYVDRQGPPDRPHRGWDLVDKCNALAAIGASAGHDPDDVWITEVNWPLRDHGDYSPAGGDVQVGEEAYADYMLRYFLLTFASGLVGRVYWWQLVARGYGLIEESKGSPGDPEGWRDRPAHAALRTMLRELGGMRFQNRPNHPDLTLLRFDRPDDRDVLVAWKTGSISGRRSPPATLRLPASAESVIGRTGREAPVRSERVEVGPSPLFIRLGKTSRATEE